MPFLRTNIKQKYNGGIDKENTEHSREYSHHVKLRCKKKPQKAISRYHAMRLPTERFQISFETKM